MNRKILLALFLLILLSGCGQRRQPDVEHFQGEVVATLQKHTSEADDDIVESVPTPSEDAQPSPQASEPAPSLTPESTLIPTVSNPQATNYPINYKTATPPQGAYPTEDLTQTPTTTLGVIDWEGVWNIWYQDTRGGYTAAELTVQVSGTRMTGTSKIDGIDFSFKGDIVMQGTQVEGEWQTASDEGAFWWRMNATDTFVGSTDARFGMCGDRGSTTQPNPCREVPQD